MKLEDIDLLAPWIEDIKYRDNKWVAHIYPGKIIEAKTFPSLMYMSAVFVSSEVIFLVAETFALNEEALRYPKIKTFDYTDARFIIIKILLERFDFSYKLILSVMHYKSNDGVTHAIKAIENSFTIQEKLEQVYGKYPFLKDKSKPIR